MKPRQQFCWTACCDYLSATKSWSVVYIVENRDNGRTGKMARVYAAQPVCRTHLKKMILEGRDGFQLCPWYETMKNLVLKAGNRVKKKNSDLFLLSFFLQLRLRGLSFPLKYLLHLHRSLRFAIIFFISMIQIPLSFSQTDTKTHANPNLIKPQISRSRKTQIVGSLTDPEFS